MKSYKPAIHSFPRLPDSQAKKCIIWIIQTCLARKQFRRNNQLWSFKLQIGCWIIILKALSFSSFFCGLCTLHIVLLLYFFFFLKKGWNRVHRFPCFANNGLMLILPHWRWILHHKHTVPMLTIHIFKNHLNVIHSRSISKPVDIFSGWIYIMLATAWREPIHIANPLKQTHKVKIWIRNISRF